MNIKGVQVKKESVTIEVTPLELVERAIDLIDTKYPKKGDHIDSKGYWKVYEWTHPHRGDEFYRQGDIATDEEKQVDHIRKFLRTLAY